MTQPSRFLVALLAAAVMAGCSAESKKARTLERAGRYFESGKYDEAKIEYLNALRADPDDLLAIRRLGIIWFEQGVPLRAVPFLLEARQRDPEDLDARTKLALSLMALAQVDKAREEVKAILGKSPAHGEALLMLVETARTPDALEEAGRYLGDLAEGQSAGYHVAVASLLRRQGAGEGAQMAAIEKALAADAKSHTAHLALANIHQQHGRPEEAAEALKKAATLAPPRSTTRLKYPELLVQRGALAEAKSILEEITQEVPDFLQAWVLLAQIALKEKTPAEALALLDNVFSRDPAHFSGRILQSEALMASGETGAAVVCLDTLKDTYENSALVEFNLARALLRDGKVAEASGAIDRAVALRPDYTRAVLFRGQLALRQGNARKLISSMEAFLERHPDEVQARLLLAQGYRAAGRLAEAAEICRALIEEYPDQVQFRLLHGIVLKESEKVGEARRVFEKAQELAPGNLLFTHQLTELDLQQKDHASALERVRAQLAATPDSATAHFLLGKVYVAQREWDQAEAALLKVLEKEDNFLGAYDLLIASYLAAGKLPEAIGQLERLLSKNPDNVAALMQLALMQQTTGAWEKAGEAYEKVLSVSPDFAPALNNLAWLYAEKFDRVEEAYELAQKARTLEPDEGTIADTLGWIAYRRGDYQKALALVREGAAKLPEHPEVQFHLGMTRYMMGHTDEARQALEKALAAETDFPGVEEARERLAVLVGASAQPDTPAVDELEAALEASPDDLVLRMRLAGAREAGGEFGKAAEEYARALELNPNLVAAMVRMAALHARHLENSQTAFEYAKKARELAPDDPQVAAVLGVAAYQNGDYEWAYGLLRESSRGSAESEVLLDYAWSAYSMGKVEEALRALDRFFANAPDSSRVTDARRFRSLIAALDAPETEMAAAVAEADAVLEEQPEYVPALMVRASLGAAHTDPAVAETYEKVLRRYPDFIPAQKRLAALYAADPDKLDRAKELAMRARKALPGDAEVARTLGEISYRQGEDNYALELLTESNRKQPLDAEGLFYMGKLQLRGKQNAKGRETLGRALAAGLEQPLRGEAEKVLSQREEE